jgi:hypothetical protein
VPSVHVLSVERVLELDAPTTDAATDRERDRAREQQGDDVHGQLHGSAREIAAITCCDGDAREGMCTICSVSSGGHVMRSGMAARFCSTPAGDRRTGENVG